jgi:hypothetical protein
MAVAYVGTAALVALLVVAHELFVRRRVRTARRLVLAALAAYVYVSALAFVLYSCRGVATARGWYAVAETLRGFDADGKLQVRDRIVAVDGAPLRVPSTRTLVEMVQASRGAPVVLAIVRGDALLSITVKPRLDHSDAGDTWRLGVRPYIDSEYEASFGVALSYAWRYPIYQVRSGLEMLAETLGQENADPGGPKRMVEEFQFASDGWAPWKRAMRDATWALVILLAFDLWRAIALARAARVTAS